MPVHHLSDLFDFVKVFFTKVSTKSKSLLAQLGPDAGDAQVESDDAEWWQHVGLASRPPKAVPGTAAAEAIIIRRGTRDAVIASQDPRGQALYGNLSDGETCLYAAGADGNAQARVLLKANGSINLFSTMGNTSGGKSQGVFIHPDGSITVASGTGAYVLIGADGSVKLGNGSGGVQVLADGHIKIASGSKVEMSGASITLGGPTALPLAVGPQVVAAITALQIEVAAVASALVACMNITGPILPIHGQTAAAATAAVGVGAGLVAAAEPLMQTMRTSAD